MKFVWDKYYNLDIKTIDDQHRHFFIIINEIYDQLDQTFQDKKKIIEILKELIEYSSYHFSLEEKYFKEFNYELADHHISKHNFFRDKINEFFETAIKVENDKIEELFSDITEFTTDWFINHILSEDKKYHDCFVEHGIK